MRSCFCLLLLLALMWNAHASSSILPTEEGTTWSYSGTGDLKKPATHVRLDGTEKVGNTDALRFETFEGDELVRTELLSVTESGIKRHQRTLKEGPAIRFNPPETVVPWPLKPGTKWTLDEVVEGTPARLEFQAGESEEVVVPAGTFQAYRLVAVHPWPLSMSIERWFAPGTGIVKEVVATRGPGGRLLEREEKQLLSVRVESKAPQDAPSPSPLNAGATVELPRTRLEVAAEREGEPVTELKSDAPNIYVRWIGEHLTPGTVARVAWIAEDVGDVAPPNFLVDQTETTVTESDFNARFTLSRPADGWAAGTYRVELYLGKELVATAGVRITE